MALAPKNLPEGTTVVKPNAGSTGIDSAIFGAGAPVPSSSLAQNWNFAEQPVAQPSAADLAARAQAAKLSNLRGQVRGYQSEVDSIYNQLFADLDALIGARKKEIETTSGDTITDLTEKYTGSLPTIQSSYAALGAGDSTDATYAKNDAKEGFEDSVKEVGTQKGKDLATLGQYDAETRAGWGADRDALNRIFSRLDETENEQDLVDARNEVENKLGTTKASRASLMTDEGLKGQVARSTDASDRLTGIQGALDSILQSSMSGAVKDAAIAAVGQSAGLTDEQKNQIKANSAYTS